uniref:Uncharacterized protein n=1 Tax=Anguilla anguilla TaxID=7936 RepID=A0A0E9X5W5_ANGAN
MQRKSISKLLHSQKPSSSKNADFYSLKWETVATLWSIVEHVNTLLFFIPSPEERTQNVTRY